MSAEIASGLMTGYLLCTTRGELSTRRDASGGQSEAVPASLMKQDVGQDQGREQPAPNRATPLSGAATSSRPRMRHACRVHGSILDRRRVVAAEPDAVSETVPGWPTAVPLTMPGATGQRRPVLPLEMRKTSAAVAAGFVTMCATRVLPIRYDLVQTVRGPVCGRQKPQVQNPRKLLTGRVSHGSNPTFSAIK